MSDNRYVLADEVSKTLRLLNLLDHIYQKVCSQVIGSALSERQYILLGHVLRAKAISKSSLLLAESGALEEVWILSRSLTELVINCGYLYIAPEQEVTNFIYLDGHKIVNQAKKLMQHRPPTAQLPDSLTASVEEMASGARNRTGLKDNNQSWSRYQDLASRAQETDKHYINKDFYTLQLTAVPYGNAGTHSTMFSLVWSLHEVVGNTMAPHERRLSMLGGAVHIIVLAINLMCLLLDEKHALGLKHDIVSACS
ncbi:hypothetical protein GOB94_07730 [Granulicella sp. 5B5]|uniref:DUF5677 domain-containing protein n=1 Tax=Granulicella sp. 5B5 TaxID=1617967 RepID=UPI0015F6584B|nr:DUF5677 domain-containing protein [Granulicella sp. 5B5]QMV18586.1 hypothetical protein GOB94_07730 [Granulicella sp. 5B5]